MNVYKWLGTVDDGEIVERLRKTFGFNYAVVERRTTNKDQWLHVIDDDFGIRWAVVPPGDFTLGMSESEWKAACRLSKEPNLSLDQMRPTKRVRVGPLLVTVDPLSVAAANKLGGVNVCSPDGGQVGVAVGDVTLAEMMAARLNGGLLREEEWEYVCRADSTTLFWFGNGLPQSEQRLENIVGRGALHELNPFGLAELFWGEWTSSIWSDSHDGPSIAVNGRVVRGGAARFWPWQDDGEWASCASAFRMPECDTGGMGGAIRVARREIKTE
jgi:formylglycine-generating enzyme required for sulfatase activity